MPDIGDAYYPAGFDLIKKGVPEGRYTASVVSLDIIEDMKFGNYIADIFKPEYMVDIEEHPKVEGETVKDNGIFRYKKVDGHLYEHKKNWGFAKFLSVMQLRKDEGKGGQLPYLYLADIKNAVILMDVRMKSFTNDLESEISYPVARAIQLIQKSPVPF